MSLIKIKGSATMDYEPFPKNSYVKYKGKPYIVVEEAATLKRMGNSYGLKRLDERGNIVGGMIDAPKSQIEELKGWDSAEAQDAWNVNDSKLIDEISKESIRALDAFSAYLAKQERLVVNTKAALAKAKQGGNLAEIKWLADALGEFENELRKARALV